MTTQYPQAQAIGALAGALLAICICIAVFAVGVSLTSGSTLKEPAAVAAKAS